MQIVKWSDDFKIGEAEIDKEHWGLFALINELGDRRAQGAIQASIESTIEALVDYIDVHFEHEERLLQEANYPGLEAHKKLHAALSRQVNEFRDDFLRAPEAFDHDEFMAFLSNWLSEHIIIEDMEYAAFLKP
ncbi:MAG: bacteriohemerythrin [Alphaproteobacteria bacterium]|jgi:hemerythrin|nr:bacteriohemerythrin [Alphaproteobacteria bacterium]